MSTTKQMELISLIHELSYPTLLTVKKEQRIWEKYDQFKWTLNYLIRERLVGMIDGRLYVTLKGLSKTYEPDEKEKIKLVNPAKTVCGWMLITNPEYSRV